MSNDTVETLKATIDKLEQRILDLEGKLTGKASGSDGMRMILIGPPGAGMFVQTPRDPRLPTSDAANANAKWPLLTC